MSKHLGEKRLCFPCSYRHGNNLRLSTYMHTRTGEKPFVCSNCSKWSTMVHGSMVVWIHGKMDPWQFGFMALWINSSLDSFPNGCIAVWIHATMDVWQFGCMVFSKTSPHTICGRPKSKHIMYAHPHLQ